MKDAKVCCWKDQQGQVLIGTPETSLLRRLTCVSSYLCINGRNADGVGNDERGHFLLDANDIREWDDDLWHNQGQLLDH
jgi:hypothetical protein